MTNFNTIIIKFTLTLVLIFNSIYFQSQTKDKFEFDYELHKGIAALAPTWDNIFNMVTMDNVVFYELMKEYDYTYDFERKYWWKMSKVEDSDFFIEFEKGYISFIWKNTSMDTSKLENKFINQPVEKLPNGAIIYKFKTEKNAVFELMIWKNEQMGIVTFSLEK